MEDAKAAGKSVATVFVATLRGRFFDPYFSYVYISLFLA
jgi:hypothetical protein